MCNLLPAGPLLPKYVPSFAAVRIVKRRRGQVFSAVEEELYFDLYSVESVKLRVAPLGSDTSSS